jgi:ankyrin repeat protein
MYMHYLAIMILIIITTNTANTMYSLKAEYLELLIAAAQAGDIEKVQKLILDNNLDIRPHNWHGESALSCALKKNHIQLAKWLIDQNININTRTSYAKITYLHNAIDSSVELVNYLIEKQADINAQARNGDTPLHYAINKNAVKIAAFLIQQGANLDIQNNKGLTPLHLALCTKNNTLAIALINNKADVNLSDEDNNNWTPLHYAAVGGYTTLVRTLINSNATIEVYDKSGNTPSDYAHRHKHSAIVEMLDMYPQLKQEIDYSPTSATLLNTVIAGFINLVKLLLQKNIPITKTHILLAKNHGHKDLNRMLINYIGITGPQSLISKTGIKNAFDLAIPHEIALLIAFYTV